MPENPPPGEKPPTDPTPGQGGSPDPLLGGALDDSPAGRDGSAGGGKPRLGEVVQERAAEVLDKVTDAAATGVEKVAGALDAMTGGLFEQRLAETGSKVADTLRAVGEPDEDDPTP